MTERFKFRKIYLWWWFFELNVLWGQNIQISLSTLYTRVSTLRLFSYNQRKKKLIQRFKPRTPDVYLTLINQHFYPLQLNNYFSFIFYKLIEMWLCSFPRWKRKTENRVQILDLTAVFTFAEIPLIKLNMPSLLPDVYWIRLWYLNFSGSQSRIYKTLISKSRRGAITIHIKWT